MVGGFISLISEELMYFSCFKTLNSLSNSLITWSNTTNTSVNPTISDDKTETISVKEIKMVMSRLGMCYEFDESEEKIVVNGDDFKGLFEEEEPSLDELREAFKVFDENRDGFIDAMELGRVLCNLGLINKDVERCKKMIRVFDRNGDGLLDFHDFLKFMETCLC